MPFRKEVKLLPQSCFKQSSIAPSCCFHDAGTCCSVSHWKALSLVANPRFQITFHGCTLFYSSTHQLPSREGPHQFHLSSLPPRLAIGLHRHQHLIIRLSLFQPQPSEQLDFVPEAIGPTTQIQHQFSQPTRSKTTPLSDLPASHPPSRSIPIPQITQSTLPQHPVFPSSSQSFILSIPRYCPAKSVTKYFPAKYKDPPPTWHQPRKAKELGSPTDSVSSPTNTADHHHIFSTSITK